MDYDLLTSAFPTTTDAEHEAAAQEVVAHLENAEREAQAGRLVPSFVQPYRSDSDAPPHSKSQSHPQEDGDHKQSQQPLHHDNNSHGRAANLGSTLSHREDAESVGGVLDPTSFHVAEELQLKHDSEGQLQGQPHDVHGQQEEDQDAGDDGEFIPDNAGLRGKSGTLGLTEEEKRRRQKEQNRRAAEKSRGKRKEESTAMEATVQSLQEQNARLRAKLAILSSSRPTSDPSFTSNADPSTSTAAPSAPTGTGLDLAYVGKLRQELSNSKSTLVDRETELARLRGDPPLSAAVERLRAALLEKNAELTQLSAEARSLESMTAQLGAEKDELSRQARVIGDELDARKALNAVDMSIGVGTGLESSGPDGGGGVGVGADGGQEDAGGGGGVGGQGEGEGDGEEHAGQEDGSLLDVRWIDEAVRNYDHSSGIPSLQALEHSDLEAIGGSDQVGV